MATKILLRGGTSAEWTIANPVLSAREMGIETDTRKFKFGDGITDWVSLAYANAGGSGDVVGTGSSDDDEIVLFDGVTGKLIKSSGTTFTSLSAIINSKGTVDSVTGTGVDNTDPDNPVITITKTTIGLSNVDNTSDTDKPVSTLQAAADLTAENNAKAYADGLVVGLWDDRGSFSAAGGAYPSSGGSGSAGAILKGDIWTISVAGTLPTGQVVEIGDVVRALVNTPGNTQANWAIQQNNIGYTAENSANKSTSVNTDQASDIKYPSVKAVFDWAVALFAPINNPTFTGTVGGITKSMVGLGNVDNTSDANKPVSTAQATADAAVLTSANAYTSSSLNSNKFLTAQYIQQNYI